MSEEVLRRRSAGNRYAVPVFLHIFLCHFWGALQHFVAVLTCGTALKLLTLVTKQGAQAVA